MRKFILLAAAFGAVLPSAPALGEQPMRASQDRREAFRGVRDGNLQPLHVIRERVAARFPDARVIGVELVGAMYRVRLMRGSDVLIVDADARSGRLLRCIGRC